MRLECLNTSQVQSLSGISVSNTAQQNNMLYCMSLVTDAETCE